MKKKFFTIMAVAALVLGMSSCGKDDNPTIVVEPEPVADDQELVGFWWEEYEYADVTEEGDPFTSVVLAVEVNEDHTGCIYLGAFDGENEDPVALYGGFDDSGFTWQLLDDGRIRLGDPETGETYALARTRGGGSYGQTMTDVSSTKLSYSNGTVTATNGGTTETLQKASDSQAAAIAQRLRANIKSNVDLGPGGKTPEGFDEDDIR